MNISEPFIRRPIATTLLTLGLILVGFSAFHQLPISALPEVDYPTIVVTTNLPGASADTMASAVTTPIERQLGQIPALSQLTSVSSFGSSQITLQFQIDRDIDAAEQDVQAALNAASSLLPRTLPTPPTYSKSNPADTPILTLAVTSERLPLGSVSDTADSILAQKISQVSGVGLVAVSGGQKPAVRIQVDPGALAGAGLGLEDVRQAVLAANVNQPKGTLDGPRQSFTISTDDQLFKAASFGPIIIAFRNGAPVRLAEIAHAVDGAENSQLAAWANDRRAVILNVQRQPGTNVIAVADRVKAILPQLSAALPADLKVSVIADRTETVRASVEDVEMTLLLTIGLVVAVIYVFLRSLRATAIPGLVVPLSLIGTFGVMYVLNYSLDNLSLMALTISTGFVVDDAIVMIENVSRYLEQGKSPFEAALKGSRQIGFTIVSLTVSLVAVLIPLLFMGGVIGRLFREFAVTLSVAIVVSALLSLTLTPTLCAYMLRTEDAAQRPGPIARVLEAGFDGILYVYDRTLRVVLAHKRTTLAATLAAVALTAALVIEIPKGLFPQQDTGIITGVTEAAPDASFSKMMGLQREAARLVLEDPAVESVVSSIGADGTNPAVSTGRLSVVLKRRDQRDADAETIVGRLGQRLSSFDGLAVHLQSVQDLQVDSRSGSTQYQYTLEDADAAELATWSARMLTELRGLPELSDVATDQIPGGRKLSVIIDRDTASRLGVGVQEIDDTLYDAFGQRQISTIFTQLNLYRVILEVDPKFQSQQDALDRIYVRGLGGTQVPLSSVARFEENSAALTVNHQGQFPSATLSFNVPKASSLGAAVEAIHGVEQRIGLPPGVNAQFTGSARAFQESLASEPLLVLAAFITVYIVLGVLYESYIHPITILSTLPTAGVGALLALEFCDTELSLVALIGIILLIGIVKKNAIMMIDFALEAERERGLSPEASIHEACLLRFRPIMMTTMAALLGGLPLALGTGIGAEIRRPLGITIVGGLLVSQVLTLYTTPVIYLYMDRLSRAIRGGRTQDPSRAAQTIPVAESTP